MSSTSRLARRLALGLLLLAGGAGAWSLARAWPTTPTVRQLPGYDPRRPAASPSGLHYSLGGRIWLDSSGAPGLGRYVFQDRSWALQVRQSEWVSDAERAELVFEATLVPAVRTVGCVARHLDELYALVPTDPAESAEELDELGAAWDPWAESPSGPVVLERWRFEPGLGWPTVLEDASAVAPLGTPSGHTSLSAAFVGGTRLAPAQRGDLRMHREPLARCGAETRGLLVDPDGRYVLVFSRDRGILRIDLATPEAPPLEVAPAPGGDFDYGVTEADGWLVEPPRLADSVRGERVLVLDDKRSGCWVLCDEDNDGDFDLRRHLGGLQLDELGPQRYLTDPRAALAWGN